MEQTLVIVSGYFNPIHIGHIKLLKEAKALGDKLLVIVNNDKQQLLKKGKIIMNENERVEIVKTIRYVDEVFLATDKTPPISNSLEEVAKINSHFSKIIFANGGDRESKKVVPETPVCEKYNLEMLFGIGGTDKPNSSSNINQLRGAEQKKNNRIHQNLDSLDTSFKKIIIADVDETICESCQVISPEMANQINLMIQNGYQFAFISGTPTKELTHMISTNVKESHHLLGTTGTNYTYIKDDSHQEIYNHSFNNEEKKEIMQAFEKLIDHFNIQSLTTKEDQLQDRESQITLSAIGRKAPSELKAKYDPNGEKRTIWIKYLKEHLDEKKYNIRFGGTTSIDITRSGLDKEWGIREFAKHHNFNLNNILFLGDKIYPGGNDYPASKIVDCIPVKNPLDTLNILKLLFQK